MRRRRPPIVVPDEESARADDVPSSTSSEETEISDEEEEDESVLDGVEGYDDVDVAELCALPLSEQEQIIAELRQRESERYHLQLASLDEKSPEAVSQLNVQSFLNKARFENRLAVCRADFVPEGCTSPAHDSRVKKIATNANRRYIFERDTDALPNASRTGRENSAKVSCCSLGPTIGKMLPGESIVDGCRRLKREREAVEKLPKQSDKEDIEWEDIPIKRPKGASNKPGSHTGV